MFVLLFFLFFFGSIVDPANPGDVDVYSSDWDVKTITSALKFYLRYVFVCVDLCDLWLSLAGIVAIKSVFDFISSFTHQIKFSWK